MFVTAVAVDGFSPLAFRFQQTYDGTFVVETCGLLPSVGWKEITEAEFSDAWMAFERQLVRAASKLIGDKASSEARLVPRVRKAAR